MLRQPQELALPTMALPLNYREVVIGLPGLNRSMQIIGAPAPQDRWQLLTAQEAKKALALPWVSPSD